MDRKRKSKFIIRGIFGFVLVLSTFLIFVTAQRLKKKDELVSSFSRLPPLKLIDADDNTFSLPLEYNSKPVILIVYSSECPFCMKEIEEVFESIEKFSHTSLLFITREDKASVDRLVNKYEVSTISKVRFSYSIDAATVDWMTNFKVPSIFIYNKDQELVKHFQGKTEISELLKYI